MDPCFLTTDSSFELKEREIVQTANLVFATAAQLAKDCSQYKPATLVHLLPNACAPDDYAPDLLECALKPDWWTEPEPPIAVYLGTLDWRFAFEHMLYAARQQPKVSFVVAGTVPLEFRKKAEEL